MGITKLERLEGKKLVKHQPPQNYKHKNMRSVTQMNVKSNTPFVSLLKRINKMLDNLVPRPNKRGGMSTRPKDSVDCVEINGMGKCIPKLMQVAIQFKAKGHSVEMHTKSVPVLDEFQDEKGEEEDVLRKRMVGSLQVKIWPI